MISCFLVYAHAKFPDDQSIIMIKQIVKILQENNIKVISDHMTAGSIGHNIVDYNGRISLRHPHATNIVIVIGTSTLLEKYNEGGHVVCEELHLVRERIKQESYHIKNRENNNNSCYSVIPVIFEANRSDVLPKFLNDFGVTLRCLNLTKKISIFEQIIPNLLNIVSQIVTIPHHDESQANFAYSYYYTNHNLPKINQKFTGRSKILRNIRESFESRNTTENNTLLITGERDQAVSGIGGMGKTQLVKQYAYNNISSYQLIWWFNAATIDEDYRALGQRLGITTLNIDSKIIQKNVHEILKNYPDWLLIYDDAINKESMPLNMPTQNCVGTRGHILITSRNSKIWRNHMQLGPFLPNEAEEFIRITTNGASQEEIRDLARELHYYPLALAQATAYISCHLNEAGGVRKYIDLFNNERIIQQDKENMLRQESSSPLFNHPAFDAYERTEEGKTLKLTVSTTIELSLKMIQRSQHSDIAEGILYLTPFLHSEKIPKSIFINWINTVIIGDYSFVFDDAMQQITSHSLISRDTASRQEGERLVLLDSYSIHQNVQYVLFDKLCRIQDCSTWRHKVSQLLDTLIIFSSTRIESYQSGAKFIPHAEAATLLSKNEEPKDFLLYCELVLKVIDYHIQYLRDPKKAEDIYNLIEQTLNRPEISAEIKARVLSSRGLIYYRSPNYIQALENYEKANTIFKMERPTIHSLENLHRIGVTFHMQGEHLKAEEVFNECLNSSIGILGNNHPHIAETRHWLGDVYEALGSYEKANEQFADAFQLLKSFYPQSIRLSDYTRELGHVNYRMHEYEAALKYFHDALALQREHYGDEHREIARTKGWISRVHNRQGRVEEALKEGLEAQKMWEKIVGTGPHPYYARILDALGNTYFTEQKLQKSLEYYEKALNIRKLTLNALHTDLAYSHEGIANVLHAQKHWSEALKHYNDAYNIFKQNVQKKCLVYEHPAIQRIEEHLIELKGFVYSINKITHTWKAFIQHRQEKQDIFLQ